MRSAAVVALSIFSAALTSNPPQHSPLENGSVQAVMHNVVYHFTDSISVHILDLEGDLVPKEKGAIPIFDDATSFLLVIHSYTKTTPSFGLRAYFRDYNKLAANEERPRHERKAQP